MPWIVGIDEAGYGPNLGPLVMTSVACRVPEALTGADLWEVLRDAVRRRADGTDERLIVDDSKLVYSTTRGLLDLEKSVLALFTSVAGELPATLGPCLDLACPDACLALGSECWYTGLTALPIDAETALLEAAGQRLAQVCRAAEVGWGLIRSVIVCPTRFNAIIERWESKGAVLAQGLAELLRGNLGLARSASAGRPSLALRARGEVASSCGSDEPVYFYIDKHGGRNTYAAMLHDALPDGLVITHEEGMQRSVYRVTGLAHEVQLTFQPRADTAHLCVALASMISKYLRELLMHEFNRFWQEQVPGLKPTAGYPGDAARYFDAIRPAAQRLGVPEAALWRRK